MELKYTLEILTKDIQDIEKLVGNLQNSPEGSTLELDLALSKLRNVYDILSAIRSELSQPEKVQFTGPAPPATERARSEPEEKPAGKQEEKPAGKQEEEPAGKPEEKPAVKQEEKPAGKQEEEPAGKQEEGPPAGAEPAPPKNAEIVAEKFSTGSSINENLAGTRETDMDSKLMGQPIDSISRNIGINDRFLIIRELFNGDSERFGKLIEGLDQAGDLESAHRLLEEQLDPSLDHEGISILKNLVKRRYNGK